MSAEIFDRTKLSIKPLRERESKLDIREIAIEPDSPAPPLSDAQVEQVRHAAEQIARARRSEKPVVLTYGAHLVKNGLALVVDRLIEGGWITHLATNGAGSIHDWEFAYLGKSSEDVRINTSRGEFGIWEETGRHMNLAVAAGGISGLGYGTSVAKLVAEDGIFIPQTHELRELIAQGATRKTPDETLGALADMLYLATNFDLPGGWVEIKHPFRQYSIQYAAYRHGVSFTVHPGIGYDITHSHPLACGGAIGRGAMKDFLTYAGVISRLRGGVHLTVGSAIMAPMIFEKSLSMANNMAIRRDGRPLSDYYLAVVDIQDGGGWDWRRGEPPQDNPAYYLRFCKSFYRAGGTLDYICMDNRDFLLNLYKELSGR